MYLINSKTGKPEEVTNEDIESFERGDKSRRSSFRSSQRTNADKANRPSKLPQRAIEIDVQADDDVRKPRSSFREKNEKSQRPSKLPQRDIDTDEPPARDGAPKITRSSDYKKQTSKSTFGSKLKKTIPGEYSRTSDKPSKYRKHDPAKPRQKPKRPAHQYAGRLLLKREYSAAVLKQRLVARGYSEEEADTALELLQRINFQSDQRFAEMTSHQLEHRKGNAQVAITLKQKGIAEDLATAVIDQMQPEEERVVRVAEKFRKDVLEAGMTHALKKKIYDFLMRRGFSSKSIKFAVVHLTKNEEDV